MTTPLLKQISPGSIVSSLVMTICTFIIIRYIGTVGDRVDTTHDDVLVLKTDAKRTAEDVALIKTGMMTRNDMTVEFLKLQKADKK